MKCVFCGSENIEEFSNNELSPERKNNADTTSLKNTKKTFSAKADRYIWCKSCGGVSRCKEFFLSKNKQKERYLCHCNDLNNIGYRVFLQNFILPVFNFLELDVNSQFLNNVDSIDKNIYGFGNSVSISIPCSDPLYCQKKFCILDYGSGPEPALVKLMYCFLNKAKITNNKYSFEIRGWDPFFASETNFFDDGADLVTCLEVAEHFELPEDGFKGLSAVCAPNGYVAVGTLCIPENIVPPLGDINKKAFFSWWYTSDKTHVSFYTKKALEECGKRAGLILERSLDDRIFIFKKIAIIAT